MSSWHCGIHHSVLIKLGNFFHTYYYFSVYTHHKEQEGVALHTLALCPPHCSCGSVERRSPAGFCAIRQAEALP